MNFMTDICPVVNIPLCHPSDGTPDKDRDDLIEKYDWISKDMNELPP